MPTSADIKKIRFHFLRPGGFFRDRIIMKRFLLRLFKKERVNLSSLNYIFCSDKDLLDINQKYLHHDYYTDIITFVLSEAGEPVIADIYISIDRIKENADSFNTSTMQELKRVIFHGALHICGYKDKKTKDIFLMRKKEEKYLSLYKSFRKRST